MGYVGLRLPDDLLSKIDEIARKERNPRSTVIRRILAEALENKSRFSKDF
jgi:metal-responsive CopG/Arc/MetJ family transcriptional regulator